MSLSEQLTSLSVCAHLLFKLWRMNGGSFIPGQLYYDIQSLIKNLYWDTAKQKADDPDVGLYIGQHGSDRLEGKFGNYQTMTHQQNVDIQQLADRAGASADLSRIFADHPEMDHGHRRLHLEGSEGVDHTNPASWTGDVIVKNVSLLTTWNAGRTEAINILKVAGVTDAPQAFAITEDERSIDMLRPEGTYVGLRESEVETATSIVSKVSATTGKANAMERDSSVSAAEPANHLEVDTLDLEDVIPDMPGENADGLFTKDNLWVDIDGHQVHKASAI
ncbi:hypothetical protein EWM64_g6596 [Hericium alpestre]|uniref:Uncharacterized protein n=1 Tax=Hericium alpestre TaxID=135208 RepID=A0A4Y9ZS60_9AGAM|nr:hypothetical protein EWM64_g6596 [Hericium alpestre]